MSGSSLMVILNDAVRAVGQGVVGWKSWYSLFRWRLVLEARLRGFSGRLGTVTTMTLKERLFFAGDRR